MGSPFFSLRQFTTFDYRPISPLSESDLSSMKPIKEPFVTGATPIDRSLADSVAMREVIATIQRLLSAAGRIKITMATGRVIEGVTEAREAGRLMQLRIYMDGVETQALAAPAHIALIEPEKPLAISNGRAGVTSAFG